MKRIKKASSEYTIAKFLTSSGLLSDPRNHCVPILDYFEDDSEEDLAFIVMPLLRQFDSPPFSFISEVVDFIFQTLEVSFPLSSSPLKCSHLFVPRLSFSPTIKG